MQKAIDRALDNLIFLYREQAPPPGDINEAKGFLQAVRIELDSQLNGLTPLTTYDFNVQHYLHNTIEKAKEEILINLQTGMKDGKLPPALVSLFKGSFTDQLRLCFSQELKDKENHAGWIAFQKMMLEAIKTDLEALLKGQAELHEGLKALKRGQTEEHLMRLSPRKTKAIETLLKEINQPARIQLALDQALNDLIGEMRLKLDLILDTTSYLKHGMQQLDERLTTNWVGKHKVVLFGMGLTCLLILAGVYYNQYTRPFSTTLSLDVNGAALLNNQYPPPTFPISITFYLPSETRRLQATGSNELILNQLPFAYKGQHVKLEIDDPYWEEAVDSIQLTAGHILIPLKPVKAMGIITGDVRSRDGRRAFSEAVVKIGTDTIISTDSNGIFHAVLPDRMKPKEYMLTVEKEGYRRQAQMYYPKSGNGEFRLQNNGQ